MLAINFNNIKDVNYVKGINISQSGLLCDIDVQLSIGTSIYLMISLPDKDDEKKIEIQAKVIRAEKMGSNNIYRTGIEFTFIEAGNKKFLHNYIAGLG